MQSWGWQRGTGGSGHILLPVHYPPFPLDHRQEDHGQAGHFLSPPPNNGMWVWVCRYSPSYGKGQGPAMTVSDHKAVCMHYSPFLRKGGLATLSTRLLTPLLPLSALQCHITCSHHLPPHIHMYNPSPPRTLYIYIYSHQRRELCRVRAEDFKYCWLWVKLVTCPHLDDSFEEDCMSPSPILPALLPCSWDADSSHIPYILWSREAASWSYFLLLWRWQQPGSQ